MAWIRLRTCRHGGREGDRWRESSGEEMGEEEIPSLRCRPLTRKGKKKGCWVTASGKNKLNNPGC